jgi:hypothetical protein
LITYYPSSCLADKERVKMEVNPSKLKVLKITKKNIMVGVLEITSEKIPPWVAIPLASRIHSISLLQSLLTNRV